MSEDQAEADLTSMTDGKFLMWMVQNGYLEGSQAFNMLSSMRTALLAATRTAEEAARSAAYAIQSAHKAQQDAEEANAEAKKKSPVRSPDKSPPGLPTPRRLTALKPGIRQPARREAMSDGFQTWNAQLPAQPEAVLPMFGGLFKDSEDKIIPWSGTDPDSNINCFSWDTSLGNWICANDSYDPVAPSRQGPVHPGQY